MNGKQGIVEGAGTVRGAIRWFQRFQDKGTSKLPNDDLAEWASCSMDDHDLDQSHRAKQLLGNLPRLPGIKRPIELDLANDEYDGSVSISDWLARQSANDRTRRLRWPARLLLLATSLAVVTGFFLRFHQETGIRLFSDQVEVYPAAGFEQGPIRLPDGPVLTLGALTELSTGHEAIRRLVFIERGDAWFSVAHNLQHTYTVPTEGGANTALSAQFDVRRTLDSADLDRDDVTAARVASK